MPSQRKYPPAICSNPLCGEEFIPHDRRQVFCTPQCRINFHNDRKHTQNQQRYFREAELRRVDQVLEALLESEFYKTDRIKREILEGFTIDFNIGTLEMNLITKNPIRWYHSLGIEFLNNRYCTIHQRTTKQL